MQLILHTIDTNDDGNPSLEYMVGVRGRIRPYADGSHPTTMVEIRHVPPITLSPLIPMTTYANNRLLPAHIHPIEGIITAIAMVGGGLVVIRQFL